jgi:hypothetical protein
VPGQAGCKRLLEAKSEEKESIMATDSSDGWDLTGIPKPYWPYVREVLVARQLFRLATLVSDKTVGEGLQKTATDLMRSSAGKLAQAGARG